MEIKKENIKINSYLVGLHSFRKDHNYGNYKGNLINEFQVLFNTDFQIVKISNAVDVLKIEEKPEFEIKLMPNAIIYQDTLGFEDICKNAKVILKIWESHSPNIKLRLMGLVTEFIIDQSLKPSNNHLRLKDQYFKNFILGKKNNQVDFHFNFVVNKNNYDYNVHITLLEKTGANYVFQGNVDFNLSSDIPTVGITDINFDRVLATAKEYFEDEIIKFLNYKG